MNAFSRQLRYSLAIAAAVALLILAAPLHAQAQKVYTSLTSTELYDIMKDLGYSVTYDDDEPEDDTVLLWRIDGKKCLILFFDDNHAIQFYVGFAGGGVSLEEINDWNANRRFSRAYLDSDNDPCLELDLDLAGGVTKDRIADYLDTCFVSFKRWYRDIIR